MKSLFVYLIFFLAYSLSSISNASTGSTIIDLFISTNTQSLSKARDLHSMLGQYPSTSPLFQMKPTFMTAHAALKLNPNTQDISEELMTWFPLSAKLLQKLKDNQGNSDSVITRSLPKLLENFQSKVIPVLQNHKLASSPSTSIEALIYFDMNSSFSDSSIASISNPILNLNPNSTVIMKTLIVGGTRNLKQIIVAEDFSMLQEALSKNLESRYQHSFSPLINANGSNQNSANSIFASHLKTAVINDNQLSAAEANFFVLSHSIDLGSLLNDLPFQGTLGSDLDKAILEYIQQVSVLLN